MRGWVIDVYRAGTLLACWVKTPSQDVRVHVPFESFFYALDCDSSRRAAIQLGYQIDSVKRTVYDGSCVRVLKLPVKPLSHYERKVRAFELLTRHRVPLYNADIPPEQQFLHTQKLYAGAPVEYKDGRLTQVKGVDLPALKTMNIEVTFQGNPRTSQAVICGIRIEDEECEGDEKKLIQHLADMIKALNPDVLSVENAFSVIPLLATRAKYYDVETNLHRFDPTPLRYRGGRTFYRYGQVIYRDYAVRLHGRFLVDSNSIVGAECDVEGIVSLCKLSGRPFQKIASRSHGAVFQGSIVRELLGEGHIVAYKQKPLPAPISSSDLVKMDRGGLAFDAIIGLHKDVVELDFSAMFPHLMIAKNITPEKVVDPGRGIKAPGVNVWIDMEEKGYIPRLMTPFLEMRKSCKRTPTAQNLRRAQALKGILVSANGYLRFREFKLGLPTTHVALCAYARDTLLVAKEESEKRGWRVLHGIVDSLYLTHPNGIHQNDIVQLCKHIEALTGIPLEFEHHFKWIIFPPSKQDVNRPVVTRYFGATINGDLKVRGLEARQKSSPKVVVSVQMALLYVLARLEADEIVNAIPRLIRTVGACLNRLSQCSFDHLAHRLVLSKSTYKSNNIQRRIVSRLEARGESIVPGLPVRFVVGVGGQPIFRDEKFVPDTQHYRKLIAQSLHSMFVGFGYSQKLLEQMLNNQGLYSFESSQDAQEELLQAVIG